MKGNNNVKQLTWNLYAKGISIILFFTPLFLPCNYAALYVVTKPTGITLPALSLEIPILCYHNIDRSPARSNELWISTLQFEQHMQLLYDSGFHTVLPGQLYDHYTKGTLLPSKPIMISFDDTHETHFSIAAPILEKYGFKGVFFIMSVCIGKKGYLAEQKIKALTDAGHAIELHTYDHPSVKKITGKQWVQQIDNPKKRLETITGKPVEYFAYPYGVWNEPAIVELKERGVKAAFQLTGKKSQLHPLYTLERMLVSGGWQANTLLKYIEKTYGH